VLTRGTKARRVGGLVFRSVSKKSLNPRLGDRGKGEGRGRGEYLLSPIGKGGGERYDRAPS